MAEPVEAYKGNIIENIREPIARSVSSLVSGLGGRFTPSTQPTPAAPQAGQPATGEADVGKVVKDINARARRNVAKSIPATPTTPTPAAPKPVPKPAEMPAAKPPTQATMRGERAIASRVDAATQQQQSRAAQKAVDLTAVFREAAEDPQEFFSYLQSSPAWQTLRAKYPKVPAEKVAERAYLDHRMRQIKNVSNPAEAGALVGDLMAYQRLGVYSQPSNAALAELRDKLKDVGQRDKWGPDETSAYMQSLKKSLDKSITGGKYTRALNDGVSWLTSFALPTGWGTKTTGEKIETAVAGEALSEARALEQGIQRYVQQDPEGSGFLGFVRNNWGALLVPAGALAMLFGGKIGKVIGGLALAGGAYNLYDRYRNLTSGDASDPVQTAIKMSLKYQDPETGEHKPLANIDAIAAQFGEDAGRVKQGLEDFAFLLRLGFKDMLIRKVYGSARSFAEDIAPGAGEAFARQREASPEAELSFPSQGGAINLLRNLFRNGAREILGT